jgi:hypothetical protein
MERITVTLTIVLILITAWYAYETRRIVAKMDQDREALTRPVLVFSLVPWTANNVKLRVENVGVGPALGITGMISSLVDEQTLSVAWQYPCLTSGKFEEFGIPIPGGKREFQFEAVRNRIQQIGATLEYVSAGGKKYQLESAIKIKEVTDSWIESHMLATEDHPDRIWPRIAKAVENVAKKIGQ